MGCDQSHDYFTNFNMSWHRFSSCRPIHGTGFCRSGFNRARYKRELSGCVFNRSALGWGECGGPGGCYVLTAAIRAHRNPANFRNAGASLKSSVRVCGAYTISHYGLLFQPQARGLKTPSFKGQNPHCCTGFAVLRGRIKQRGLFQSRICNRVGPCTFWHFGDNRV